jgi:hypothetical protein
MSSLKSNDTSYDINILTGIAIAGIIMKVFLYQTTSETGDVGPANSSIWGYGVIFISLLGILYVTFSLASKSEMESGVVEFMKAIYNSSFPVLFFMGLIIWLIVMNISYQSRINKGQVSNDYYKFGFISTFLIALQLLIILKYVRDKMGMSQNASSSGSSNMLSNMFNQLSLQMASIGYAVGTINYAIVAIMQIILEYFSTDG